MKHRSRMGLFLVTLGAAALAVASPARAQAPASLKEFAQGVVTTTPKPIPIIRDLLAGKHGPTAISRGSMYDNRANLDDEFVNTIEGAYLGTRLAQQEIHGAVVDSVEGAIWDPDIISRWRLKHAGYVPELVRIVEDEPNRKKS